MTIIEIKALSNGGHRNQSGNFATIPNGWAIIPESVGNPDTLENFPFGEVTTKELDGVMTVTKWIPGTKPEPTETEIAEGSTLSAQDDTDAIVPVSELEQLRADVDYIAIMTGVEL